MVVGYHHFRKPPDVAQTKTEDPILFPSNKHVQRFHTFAEVLDREDPIILGLLSKGLLVSLHTESHHFP